LRSSLVPGGISDHSTTIGVASSSIGDSRLGGAPRNGRVQVQQIREGVLESDERALGEAFQYNRIKCEPPHIFLEWTWPMSIAHTKQV
jgi:hypothetical protein